MRHGQGYSAGNYYTLGRVFPRERLRQPYPRKPPPRPTAAEAAPPPPTANSQVPYKTLRGGHYGRFF